MRHFHKRSIFHILYTAPCLFPAPHADFHKLDVERSEVREGGLQVYARARTVHTVAQTQNPLCGVVSAPFLSTPCKARLEMSSRTRGNPNAFDANPSGVTGRALHMSAARAARGFDNKLTSFFPWTRKLYT